MLKSILCHLPWTWLFHTHTQIKISLCSSSVLFPNIICIHNNCNLLFKIIHINAKGLKMGKESGSHPRQSCFPIQRPQGNSGEAKNFSSFWLSPFLAPPERIRVNLILLKNFSGIRPSVWNRSVLLWVLLNGKTLHKGKQGQMIGVWVCSVKPQEVLNPWNSTILRIIFSFPLSCTPDSKQETGKASHPCLSSAQLLLPSAAFCQLATPWQSKILHISPEIHNSLLDRVGQGPCSSDLNVGRDSERGKPRFFTPQPALETHTSPRSKPRFA